MTAGEYNPARCLPYQAALPAGKRPPQQLGPDVRGTRDGAADAHETADAVGLELPNLLYQGKVEKTYVKLFRRVLREGGRRRGAWKRQGVDDSYSSWVCDIPPQKG